MQWAIIIIINLRCTYQYSIDSLVKNFFVVDSIKSVGTLDKLLMCNTPSLITLAVDFVGFIAQCCLSSRNAMMQALVKNATNASQNEIIKVCRTHFHHGSFS